MTKAIIYARVSTDEQAKSGNSLSVQVKACQKYAAEHGLNVVKVFTEDYTGAERIEDRPEGGRLVTMLRRREAEAVIVYTQDRLSRNLAHTLVLREEWQRARIELHYVDRGQAKDTAEARLMQNIEGVIAEYEREKIRKRAMDGKREKVASGRVLGGGIAPYGYRYKGKKKDTQLVIADDEAKIVRLVFHWFTVGDDGVPLGPSQIADRLDAMGVPTCEAKRDRPSSPAPRVWTAGIIYHLLRRELYTGVWFSNRQKVTGKNKRTKLDRSEWVSVHVPAIVPRDVWEATQRRIKKGRNGPRGTGKYEYLLTGRLKCSCGYHAQGKPSNSYLYYYCNGRWRRKTARRCDMPGFRVKAWDALIWNWIESIIMHPDQLIAGMRAEQATRQRDLKPLTDRLALVDEQIAKHKEKLDRLADLYIDGEFSREVLGEKRAQLQKVLASLDEERGDLLERIAGQEITDTQIRTIEEFAADAREGLQDVTFDDKRRMLEWLDFSARLACEDGQLVMYAKCMVSSKRFCADEAYCRSCSVTRTWRRP